jgi:hypothetical protein
MSNLRQRCKPSDDAPTERPSEEGSSLPVLNAFVVSWKLVIFSCSCILLVGALSWLDTPKTSWPDAPKTSLRQVISAQEPPIPLSNGDMLSSWPVSIYDDEDDDGWESLLHAGDGSTKLTVPRFWSLPLDSRNFTRSKAMVVGTCAKPEYNAGDSCPLEERTIFVTVSSYRNGKACQGTIDSLLETAKYPHRIRLAIVEQLDPDVDAPCYSSASNAQYPSTIIDVFQMAATLGVGPTLAHHIGHRIYRGEYYTVQLELDNTDGIDFTPDWDVDLIQQWKQTGNEMAVLSNYLLDNQNNEGEKETGAATKSTHPVLCSLVYDDQGSIVRYGSQPVVTHNVTSPQLTPPLWSKPFSFARGHFMINVPSDPFLPMLYQGEETSISVRAFTKGYDFYSPVRSIGRHTYDRRHGPLVRRPTFWENNQRYEGLGNAKSAATRLASIVHMKANNEATTDQYLTWDQELYGIGSARTPESFYSTYGIDRTAQTIHPGLCQFVVGVESRQPLLHALLSQFLKPDGMGIDYGKVRPWYEYGKDELSVGTS